MRCALLLSPSAPAIVVRRLYTRAQTITARSRLRLLRQTPSCVRACSSIIHARECDARSSPPPPSLRPGSQHSARQCEPLIPQHLPTKTHSHSHTHARLLSLSAAYKSERTFVWHRRCGFPGLGSHFFVHTTQALTRRCTRGHRGHGAHARHRIQTLCFLRAHVT